MIVNSLWGITIFENAWFRLDTDVWGQVKWVLTSVIDMFMFL